MKTRFFCVAVEGATTDGRVIEASWIKEMADNYNPTTYGARVNMEHIRGYSPEPPFNSYGDVLALEAREIELTVNGKAEKKLALFAQIDANDQLVGINKKGQKLYTSIEVNPNFAGKGQAYLMGVAVTDSPASLGTEMLQFAAQATVNPFAARKQHADNLFTATGEPVAIEFDDAAAGGTPAAGQAFSFDTIMAAAAKHFGLGKSEVPAEPVAGASPAAGAGAEKAIDMAAGFAALGEGLTKFAEQSARDRTTDRADFDQLASDVRGLKADLSSTPSQNHAARPAATGDAGGVATDC